MTMNWNRIFLILSGSPEDHPKLIAAAGIFVIVWFAMDVIQFVDWATTKVSPTNIVCNEVITKGIEKWKMLHRN